MGGAVAAMAFTSWTRGRAGLGGTLGLADNQPGQCTKSPDETTPSGAETLTAAIEAMTAQLWRGGVLRLAAN